MGWLNRTAPPRAVDLGVAALIALFAVLALQVHDSISGLAGMARGIRDTGTAIEQSGAATGAEIRESVGAAADALGSVPLLGGGAGDSLRDTATRTAEAVERESRLSGQRLVTAGEQGERDARSTARLVGWLSFLIPTVLLLAQYLPTRVTYVDGRWTLRRPAPQR